MNRVYISDLEEPHGGTILRQGDDMKRRRSPVVARPCLGGLQAITHNQRAALSIDADNVQDLGARRLRAREDQQ
jgi:hypothetical protein